MPARIINDTQPPTTQTRHEKSQTTNIVFKASKQKEPYATNTKIHANSVNAQNFSLIDGKRKSTRISTVDNQKVLPADVPNKVPLVGEQAKRLRGRPRKNILKLPAVQLRQAQLACSSMSSEQNFIARRPECPICQCQIVGDELEVATHVNQCIEEQEEARSKTPTDLAPPLPVASFEPPARPHPYTILRASQSETSVDVVEDDKDGLIEFTNEQSDQHVSLERKSQYTLDRLKEILDSFSPTDTICVPALPKAYTLDALERLTDHSELIKLVLHYQTYIGHHQSNCLRCTICLDPFDRPVVSTLCWHVYCEVCWARTILTKRLCPQCNLIISPHHLRRIYL